MHVWILAPVWQGLCAASAAAVSLALVSGARPVEFRLPGAQQFTARTEIVEVYATVTDDRGRLMTDLTQDEFVVYEDGVPQAITSFTAGDVPVSLAVALDRSWSMAGVPLAAAQTGVRALLHELGDRDRVTLLAISSQVDVVVPLTNDRQAIDRAVHALDPWGSTAIHDAVVRSLDVIEPAPGRRALVLVSDGQEKYSHVTAEAVYERVRRSDVMVYPVALARRSPALFNELAALSGGRTSATRRAAELPRILRRFAVELRHQYLIGYAPDPARSPGYRRLRVEVSRPGYLVRARSGYTVPGH
jgi:Ca-activated chloride channel homolog